MADDDSTKDGQWTSRNRSILELGGLVVLCLVAHGRIIDGGFHYDDLHSIVDNPHIRSLSLVPTLFTDPGTFSGLDFGGMFRPLIMLSYSLTFAVSGLEPMAFLLTNLLLHVGVVVLGFIVFCHVWHDRRPAIVAAALFAVHPINVETVAYVSSRSESFCGLFMLAAFLAHLKIRESAWPCALILLFALMCKSIAIVLVPLLWIHDGMFVRDTWQERGRRLWPLGLVVVGYLWVVSGLLSTAVLDAPVRPLTVQLMTQVKALVYYAHLLTIPWGLSVEHQFSLGSGEDLAVWLSLIALFSSGVVILRCSGPKTRWWLLWSGLILLPTLIVPLNVLVNEHRLYLVSLGLTILLASLVLTSRVVIRGASTLALLVLILLSFQRTATWADSTRLWQDALDRGPLMPRPHLFVGDAHFVAGQHGLALERYATALTVNPRQLSAADQLVLHNNRGATLLAMGAFDEAGQAFEQALRIDPTYGPALESLQGIRALQKSSTGAETAAASRRAGLASLVAGDVHAAIQHLSHSVGIENDTGTWMALAGAHERLEQWAEAARIYQMLSTSNQASERALERLAAIESKSIEYRRASGGGTK